MDSGADRPGPDAGNGKKGLSRHTAGTDRTGLRVEGMMVHTVVSIGFAPNGQEMFSWFEGDIQYTQYWMAVPGGGLVQVREG